MACLLFNIEYSSWSKAECGTNTIIGVTNLTSRIDDVTVVFGILELDRLCERILNCRIIRLYKVTFYKLDNQRGFALFTVSSAMAKVATAMSTYPRSVNQVQRSCAS
jgi:hypothetical protein